jgi:Lrp/AsnC ligand binding domain
VIASHIPVQAQAGPAPIVTAAVQEVPGVRETASVAGPCDVIIWAGTRDTGQLARLVTSRARAPGGGTRAGGCPVVYR